jgi:hypothetical protein
MGTSIKIINKKVKIKQRWYTRIMIAVLFKGKDVIMKSKIFESV